MKYSIIFCYRDRQEHLNIVLPRIKKVFEGCDHEIIVVEQNDNEKFRRSNTLNFGAKKATGDILIFHDVDYYPVNVKYFDEVSDIDVFLPVHCVEFVRNDFTPRPTEDIPAGYREFRHGVDQDFYGGVISFKRDAFFKINGFNSLFKGWGFEDADLRLRIQRNNLRVARGYGNLFVALDHKDNCPSINDPDFQKNMIIHQNSHLYAGYGVSTQQSPSMEIRGRNPLVDKWYATSGFKDYFPGDMVEY
jgi:hypothetical protein